MSRILIGNIKGPQGARGIQGPPGPVGAPGPEGPMPPLINNVLATEAGVAALDAAMGKYLQDQLTQLNQQSIKYDEMFAENKSFNITIIFGTGKTTAGFYYSNSFLLPINKNLTLEAISIIGSSEEILIDTVMITRSMGQTSFYTPNDAVAGKVVSVTARLNVY